MTLAANPTNAMHNAAEKENFFFTFWLLRIWFERNRHEWDDLIENPEPTPPRGWGGGGFGR